MPTQSLSTLREQAERELTGNILPFWVKHGFVASTGNLAGVVTNDLRHINEVPRHVVLCARLLWTFAAAQRVSPSDQWLAAGRQALRLLDGPFRDVAHGGVYWSLSPNMEPLSRRKQIYAQAFSIYGFAEWYAATGDMAALARAQALYRNIEFHALDTKLGGYVEALDENWAKLDDMRLSDKDLNAPKSMNTLLHVMEAYAALLRVWPDAHLRASLSRLIHDLIDKVHTCEPHSRFALFFDMEWNSLNNTISYGHDIETSWLLWDAAQAVGERGLLEKVRPVTLSMARAVLDHGVDQDGALFYEGDASGIRNSDKHWWPQAEAVVGFLNAHQLSGDAAYLEAAIKTWAFIENHLVDRKYGEWFSHVGADGRVLGDYDTNPDYCKIGPWKCPYHNARACIEMMRRLPEGTTH